MQLETDEVRSAASGLPAETLCWNLLDIPHPPRTNLRTLQHWYSLFGFFDAQSTEDERLELIHPRTRDSFLDEALLVLKTDPNDVLKTSILVFLEEHYDFFLDDRGRFAWVLQTEQPSHSHLQTLTRIYDRLQRTCAILSETLNHPTMSGQVKCQVLTTLTSIMITRDVLHFQPRALESFMNILFAIASQLNAPMDRLLRQTVCFLPFWTFWFVIL
jgi:hypothetical protein